MAELTHRLIKDGWFAEISDEQWPGQAMTLRVKKVLHVEQSLYQDVLVFESTDHGNVLVLDGAIQCVERDEFSYQEMITHLPLASHPNPVSVLVIGGGDGGVLREVLKHPSVKSAVLCDIDEAVPRVSKAFLPHMAAGFNDPRVTVHIGDGFKFLADKKCEFDVIITDSSDPVGPAESLFQKPYFQLLKESLKPGGSISTQGECIWLHLPLIDNLMTMTRTLFPVAEFGYTSIPTYPSGTIGFVVCTLDPTRDLRTPLRNVEGCRYWSPEIHRAAFVLPTFAQKVADNSRKPAAITASTAAPKKILLLGSGFVAQPTADYVLRRAENSLTIGCRTLSAAQGFASKLSRDATAISVDVSDEASLDAAVKEHDLIISLIPYTFHAAVIKSAIKFKKNVVTTSYVSEAMKALEPACIEAGITVLNEIGLDPGIDHVAAVLLIDRVHKAGGKIKEFFSYCGGLPAAEAASSSPLGYKFSWSSRGVLLALRNSAKYLKDGKIVEIDGPDLMAQAKPYYISPAFAFIAYPNRDSTTFVDAYNIPEATTCIRGTLRFQGFTDVIGTWVEMGLMNSDEQAHLQPGAAALTWIQVTAKVVGAEEVSEASVVNKLSQLKALSDTEIRRIVISKMRKLGLFSNDVVSQRGTLLDVLCATLEQKMKFEAGERDLVMLQHKFIVERADGKIETITSTLESYGSSTGGYSAMATTVGIPAGIAVQLILDGKITKKGVNAPYDVPTCELLNAEFEKEGINMVEAIE